MSKPNKANKNNYTQAGRLTPDQMGRELVNQGEMTRQAKSKENVTGKVRVPNGARESTRPRTGREEPE
jgi:hypothetical protein